VSALLALVLAAADLTPPPSVEAPEAPPPAEELEEEDAVAQLTFGAVSTVNGGVSGLVHSLAWELAPIRVNAIHPGITGDSPYWEGKPPAILEGHRSKTITQKLATMDDIVDGTRFLLENPSVEAIDLVVDNGRMMF